MLQLVAAAVATTHASCDAAAAAAGLLLLCFYLRLCMYANRHDETPLYLPAAAAFAAAAAAAAVCRSNAYISAAFSVKFVYKSAVF